MSWLKAIANEARGWSDAIGDEAKGWGEAAASEAKGWIDAAGDVLGSSDRNDSKDVTFSGTFKGKIDR